MSSQFQKKKETGTTRSSLKKVWCQIFSMSSQCQKEKKEEKKRKKQTGKTRSSLKKVWCQIFSMSSQCQKEKKRGKRKRKKQTGTTRSSLKKVWCQIFSMSSQLLTTPCSIGYLSSSTPLPCGTVLSAHTHTHKHTHTHTHTQAQHTHTPVTQRDITNAHPTQPQPSNCAHAACRCILVLHTRYS